MAPGAMSTPSAPAVAITTGPAKGNVYVCDHCGHEVLTVKGADGVKGYAGTLAGNEPQYASTSEAQAAAEKREAAYAASIAALQAQVAAREAAYAASLGIH